MIKNVAYFKSYGIESIDKVIKDRLIKKHNPDRIFEDNKDQDRLRLLLAAAAANGEEVIIDNVGTLIRHSNDKNYHLDEEIIAITAMFKAYGVKPYGYNSIDDVDIEKLEWDAVEEASIYTTLSLTNKIDTPNSIN